MSKKREVLPNLAKLNHHEKMTMAEAGELRFYMVVNSNGEFFRSKGRDGYSLTWTTDIKKARVYNKIGPARSIVTIFSKNTSYDPPKILEIGPDGRRYVL